MAFKELEKHLTFLSGVAEGLQSKEIKHSIESIEKIAFAIQSDISFWKEKAVNLGYKIDSADDIFGEGA